MNHTLRLASVIIYLICGMLVNARDCGACHGKGIVRVFVGVGNFGVEGGRTRQCQHCGKYIASSDNHYCICKTCGGTGEIGKSKGESSMLYPEEAQNVQTIMGLLNYGEPYFPDCSACKGSGNCPVCQGASRYSYYDWDTGLTYGACVACGNSGICPTCKGGKKGPKQYRPINDQQRVQYIDLLRSILQAAASRTQR